jgi:hypothetical protein
MEIGSWNHGVTRVENWLIDRTIAFKHLKWRTFTW